MKVIGLTGGIATGKSKVSAILKKAGAVIIDADRIAREAVKKGSPAYRKIVDNFGETILLPDGEINRSELGDIVFNDSRKMQLLNRIVHPCVTKETNRRLRAMERSNPEAIVVLDIPLLFEAQMHTDLSEIIVVYAPEHIQIERLMKRDKISEADAVVRVRVQMSIEEKKNRATFVIDNSGSLKDTCKQTLEIFKSIKDLPERKKSNDGYRCSQRKPSR